MQSNGVNLYYEAHGSGEPLLLIMGFTVSSVGWYWNTPTFAQNFRTIVFDNRGVGQSDKPDLPYSMQMFADDTAGLLDGLGVDRAHVFGISRGGMIAEDGLVPPENSVTLAQRIPNADLVFLSNASHLFNMELPEATADVVKRFIGRRREWA
jgi:pimeloyl-ACP methyl ester carboxylesterase